MEMLRSLSPARWVRNNIRGGTVSDYGKAADSVKIGGAAVGSVAAFACAGSDVWPNIHGLPSSADLPLDKLLHGETSCILTVVAHVVIGMPPWLAAASTFLLGAGKEVVYDKMLGHGTPDVKDAVANLSGCLAGYSLSKAIESRRKHG